MNQDKAFLESMLRTLKLHRSGLFLVIRVTFILAYAHWQLLLPNNQQISSNLSSFIEEIRFFIYFKLNGMADILEAFDYYIDKELKPGFNAMDAKMRTSFTNIEVAISKKESIDLTRNFLLMRILLQD